MLCQYGMSKNGWNCPKYQEGECKNETTSVCIIQEAAEQPPRPQGKGKGEEK